MNINDQESMMALEALLQIRSRSSKAMNCNSNPSCPMPSDPIITPAQNSPLLQEGRSTLPLAAIESRNNGECPTTNTPVFSTIPTTTIAAQEHVIRKEKIEAALRSKPQRGKKRDNLSVLERIELTRTRNREHAKTTRIRKKARYQDLVEKEKHLDDLQQAAALVEARRQVVQAFITCREVMFQSHHGGTGMSPTVKSSLQQHIDVNHFSFSVGTSKENMANGFENSFALMNQVDSNLQRFIEKKFLGQLIDPAFLIVDGNQGIAFTTINTCICQLSLVGSANGKQTNVMDFMIKFGFSGESKEISRVVWGFLSADVSTFASKDQSSVPKGLKSQISFPSVVSLNAGDQPSEPESF